MSLASSMKLVAGNKLFPFGLDLPDNLYSFLAARDWTVQCSLARFQGNNSRVLALHNLATLVCHKNSNWWCQDNRIASLQCWVFPLTFKAVGDGQGNCGFSHQVSIPCCKTQDFWEWEEYTVAQERWDLAILNAYSCVLQWAFSLPLSSELC